MCLSKVYSALSFDRKSGAVLRCAFSDKDTCCVEAFTKANSPLAGAVGRGVRYSAGYRSSSSSSTRVAR